MSAVVAEERAERASGPAERAHEEARPTGLRSPVAVLVAMEALYLVSFTVLGLRMPFVSHLGDRWGWVYGLICPIVPVEWGRDYWVYADGPSLVLGLVLLAGLPLLLWVALRAAWRCPSAFGLGLVLGGSALFHATMALQPYLLSQDVFSYAMYGRILAHYQASPYGSLPRDFPFDPLYSQLYWKGTASNYGPLWNWVGAGVVGLVGDEVAVLVLAFRQVAMLSSLASAALIWCILGRLEPRHRAVGTLLWAWNPLVVVESATSAHNDALMVLLILAAVYLHLRGRLGLALVALTLSALVKYASGLLIPMYCLLLWRRGGVAERIRLAGALAGSLALAVALYAPLFAGWRTFGFATFGASRATYANSPGEALFYLTRRALGQPRDVAVMPLDFQPWWAQARRPTALFSRPEDPALRLAAVGQGQRLLVVESPLDDWLHVYDPASRQYGYVGARLTRPSRPPPEALDGREPPGVANDPEAVMANRLVRLGLGLPFAALALWLTWRVRSLDDFLQSGLVTLLISTVLAWTFFFPWYVLWALALAALRPGSAGARLTALASAGALMVYVFGGMDFAARHTDLYQFRGLAVYGLPCAAWLALEWRWRPAFPWRAAGRAPAAALLTMALAGCGAVASARPAPRWDPMGRGVADFRRGAPVAAILDLTLAIEANSGATDAHYYRGLAELKVGAWRAAVDDFTAVLAREPGRVDALLARGAAFEGMERLDGATADYQRAVQLRPESAAGQLGLGQALFKRGLLGPAVSTLERAVTLYQLHPDEPDLRVLDAAGDDPVVDAPDSGLGQACGTLAAVEASSRRLARALEFYDCALAADSGNVRLLRERAHALELAGRHVEAATAFARLAQTSPRTADSAEVARKLATRPHDTGQSWRH